MPDNRSRSRSPRRTPKETRKDDKPSSSSRGKDEKRESERKTSRPSSRSNNSFTGSPSSAGFKKERKFTGRCRLFVGNLVSCDEEELSTMFKKYGEVAETFVNKEKGFGFIRLVSHINSILCADGCYRLLLLELWTGLKRMNNNNNKNERTCSMWNEFYFFDSKHHSLVFRSPMP